MPWHVGHSSSCPESKPWAVIQDDNGRVMGCHESEEAANAQLRALYANESLARGSAMDEDQIDTAIATVEGRISPPAQFKIFTGILKAWADADGKKRLKGVASSTTRDLHGDTMLQSALEDMERDAANNLTIFLNHSYDVPEDVAGSVEHARMIQRGADGDGNPNWDLDFQILVNETNPRAVAAWEAIDKGTKLGLSIGALIPEGGATRDKKSGALTIAHVNLLETSIVSIPANPRSWISNAVKAITKAAQERDRSIQLGSPTLTLRGDEYTIRGKMDGLQLGAEPDAEPAIVMEPAIVDAGACPDCGGDRGSPKGGCGNGYHKDVEPDVTDAKVTIIEVDTGDSSSSGDDSSQGAGDSDPGDEEWAAEPSTTAAADPAALATLLESLGPSIRSGFLATLRQLESTAAALLTTREELAMEQAARKEAERVRDEVIQQAGTAMSRMQEIFARLADTPIGRKASFRAAQGDLEHLAASGIYSQEFLKLAEHGR